MLYQIKDGTVSAGGHTILSHIEFYIKEKEKLAVVGKNAEEMAAGAVKAMSKLPEKTIITKRKISETKITETKISETMPGS